MPTILESFPYPPLPAGVDAIRILTVEPGDFADPFVCTLTSVPFSSKPKYVALSYTWGPSYPDNAALPLSPKEAIISHQPSKPISEYPKNGPSEASTDHAEAETLPRDKPAVSSMIPQSQVQANITLSGAPFHVNHNLYLAMLHLRSPTHPLTLWVDAICINQADMEERNAQVAMMSFIYTRALKVAAWLGVKEYKNQVDLFRSMSSDWKAGQARQFAASLVGETKLHYSLEPDKITLARIAECSYWVRLWIVQEACLPRLLVFVYGSKIWAYEDLHQFEAVKAIRSEPPGPRFSEDVVDDEFGDMLRLFDTRNAKYTDTMMLEYLLELFAKSRCAESRDRVYGLLGLANDTSPFSRVDDYVDSIDEYINSLDPQQEILLEPQRGMGSFKVDYSRSFYDIWTDVVKFVFFRAKNIQRRYSKQSMNVESALFDENKAFIREERRISVVRTAGIVQQALDQKVEEEAANLNYAKGSASSYFFSDPQRPMRLTNLNR